MTLEPETMAVATVATGCQNCDHVAEFHGVVVDDVAYFPCLSCNTVFTIGDSYGGWSNFFDQDEDDE